MRNGRRSGVSLEDPFWRYLRKIAAREKISVSELVRTLDYSDHRGSLASAIRVFVLEYFQTRALEKSSQDGHLSPPNKPASGPSSRRHDQA
jgi:predicted DNA-binding ribbon-helix-helix protein